MTLHELKAAGELVAAELGLAPEAALGALMIYFCEGSIYPETPVNSVCFADEAADGAHFAFLLLDQRPLHELPVISVAPFDGIWACAGENLREFVELQAQFCEDFAREEGGPGAAKNLEVVRLLRRRLGLKRRPDYDERLEELDRMYLPRMELRPEVWQELPEELLKRMRNEGSSSG